MESFSYGWTFMLKSHFMRQKMMTKVLISLIPLYLMAIFLFGWRVLLMLAAVTIAGCIAEILVMKQIQGDKFKLTEACFVSCALFTLTLPPATPIWVGIVGIVFGIAFGKAVFGGFGQNIFNPALVARCFIYIGFPTHLTLNWTEPFRSLPGGFTRFFNVDALTFATPMIEMRDGLAPPSLGDMLLGFTSGSLGETSIILIVLAGIYLIVTKTASWKIMLSTVASAGILSTVFYLTGLLPQQPQYMIFSGGLFFAAVFMATDPVSAPRGEEAKWIFGVMIGVFAVIIRRFSLFTEGVMFAILIANALTPLVERNIREWKKARADKAAARIETAPATEEVAR